MGMAQIKRNIQDRMSIIDVDTAMPIQIINQRPLQARIKEFFTTKQQNYTSSGPKYIELIYKKEDFENH